jgi:nicotinate-nucleotide adenylyltransferase
VAPADNSAVGILGGTFNPPHVGHLAVARAARAELALTTVLLMPTNTAPHKQHGQDPGPEHRLRMCRLAAADVEGVDACALEVQRGGVSYTVDSLGALHDEHPLARLTLILGADTACTLGSWRQPARLLQLAGLGVAARSGTERQAVLDAVAAIARERFASQQPAAQVAFLAMPAIDVSSSLVRRRVAAGQPVTQLVGAAVAAYIAEHGLYGAGDGEAGR